MFRVVDCVCCWRAARFCCSRSKEPKTSAGKRSGLMYTDVMMIELSERRSFLASASRSVAVSSDDKWTSNFQWFCFCSETFPSRRQPRCKSDGLNEKCSSHIFKKACSSEASWLWQTRDNDVLLSLGCIGQYFMHFDHDIRCTQHVWRGCGSDQLTVTTGLFCLYAVASFQ